LAKTTGIEPAPPGYKPGALHELHSQSFVGGTRPRNAHRASQVYEPGHKASRRRRASKGKARRKDDRVQCLTRIKERIANGE